MENLGMISARSAYTNNPVYGVTEVSYKQKDFDEKKSSEVSSLKDDINDEAVISDEAKALLEADEAYSKDNGSENETKSSDTSQKTQDISSFAQELTPAQKQQIAELKIRDSEVKAHEQAHLAAASGIGASAPHYDYEVGPDGKKYAVGGEVNISFTKSQNPSENLANAQTMKTAALAPAQPSGQDRAVAAKADRLIAEAKQEIKEAQTEQMGQTEQTGASQQADESQTAESDLARAV